MSLKGQSCHPGCHFVFPSSRLSPAPTQSSHLPGEPLKTAVSRKKLDLKAQGSTSPYHPRPRKEGQCFIVHSRGQGFGYHNSGEGGIFLVSVW